MEMVFAYPNKLLRVCGCFAPFDGVHVCTFATEEEAFMSSLRLELALILEVPFEFLLYYRLGFSFDVR